MRLLLLIENHFFEDKNGDIWCNRINNYEYFKNYLDNFEEVIVLARMSKLSDCKGKLKSSGNRLFFVGLPEFVGAKGFVKNYFKIKKIINDNLDKCDCVLYRAPSHLSIFTYKLPIRKNKVLSLEFVGTADYFIDGNSFIKRIINKIINNKTKKMCKNANGVLYVTEKFLQEKYPCKAIINGESKYFFTEGCANGKFNLLKINYDKEFNEKKFNQKKIKIVLLGYMDSNKKGHIEAIYTVFELLKKGYDVELNFIGDGRKKADFQKLCKDLNIEKKVIFKGSILEQNKLFSELKKNHILILPSYCEGLPRCIIEAMANGLVCLSSNAGGCSELLDNSYIVMDNNIKTYVEKISYLLDNRNIMISNSFDNYKKSLKYDNKYLNKKQTNFYKKMIKAANEKYE